MKKAKCEECDKEKPINEITIYEEKKYCKDCLSKEEDSSIPDANLIRMVDDTICAYCNFDNGKDELKKITNLPLCEKCYSYISNRPFPQWIKTATIFLCIIVLFGLVYNSKYLLAYFDIRESMQFFEVGNLEEAYKSMNLASEKLPHIEYLKGISAFYEGIHSLYTNKPKKALSLFESYRRIYPFDNSIKSWILKAKAGISYDSKDYQNFYTIQKELYELNQEDIISIAGVASGASCLYVSTKDRKYKNEMNKFIELARKKIQPGQEKMFNEYIQRIRYRVYSNEIISSKEYYEKFPEGWKGDKK